MSDFPRILVLGAQGFNFRPATAEPKPDIASLEGANRNQAPTDNSQQHRETSKDANTLAPPKDADVLTGPPPAFQASLLEVEADLQTVIKRVEAAREHARAAEAIAPEPALQASQSSQAEPSPVEATANNVPTAPYDFFAHLKRTE